MRYPVESEGELMTRELTPEIPSIILVRDLIATGRVTDNKALRLNINKSYNGPSPTHLYQQVFLTIIYITAYLRVVHPYRFNTKGAYSKYNYLPMLGVSLSPI